MVDLFLLGHILISFGLSLISLIIYAILNCLGFNHGVQNHLSLIPFYLTVVASLVYMAKNSRRASKSSPSLKRENRTALTIVVAFVISFPLFRKWALAQGISGETFNTIAVVSFGLVFLAIAFLPHLTFSSYRRLSHALGGLTIIAIGILNPSAGPPEKFSLTVSLIGIVGFSLQALLAEYF